VFHTPTHLLITHTHNNYSFILVEPLLAFIWIWNMSIEGYVEKIGDFHRPLWCPGCDKMVKFMKISELNINPAPTPNNHNNNNHRQRGNIVVEVVHTTCVDELRRTVYVCLGCERRSNQSLSNIKCNKKCHTTLSPEVSSSPAVEAGAPMLCCPRCGLIGRKTTFAR